MSQPVCVITGATDGIGLVAARALAQAGMEIVLVGRSAAKGEAAVNMVSANAGGKATFFCADLSSLTEVARVGEEISQQYPRIDVLVNNAGAFFASRRLSVDGIERTFALNHLGYFALTYHLMPTLRTGTPARIINVASRAHRGPQIDLDDINFERGYRPKRAYQMSKLANIHFTMVLAKRLRGTTVTCNCLHPGFVSTNFGMNNGWMVRAIVRALMRFSAITVEEGAKTSIYLASSEDVATTTGKYFVECQEHPTSEQAQDVSVQDELWRISERMTGLEWPQTL
ncbi:MAG: SDR family oxidoreductase [Gammaproteobacteria bacterium]|nr:SDR family oxidoreductase [Gammaproteobacteria bacterium]